MGEIGHNEQQKAEFLLFCYHRIGVLIKAQKCGCRTRKMIDFSRKERDNKGESRRGEYMTTTEYIEIQRREGKVKSAPFPIIHFIFSTHLRATRVLWFCESVFSSRRVHYTYEILPNVTSSL